MHCRNSVQAVVSGRQSPSLTSHSCPGSIWPLYWTNVHLAMSPTVFLSHPRLSNGKSTQGSSYHSNCVMPSPFTRARDRPFQEQSLTLANLNFQWGVGLLLFQGKKSLNIAYFTQWHSKGYKTFLGQRDWQNLRLKTRVSTSSMLSLPQTTKHKFHSYFCNFMHL